MILRSELESRVSAVKAGIARKDTRITDLAAAGAAQLAGVKPVATLFSKQDLKMRSCPLT